MGGCGSNRWSDGDCFVKPKVIINSAQWSTAHAHAATKSPKCKLILIEPNLNKSQFQQPKELDNVIVPLLKLTVEQTCSNNYTLFSTLCRSIDISLSPVRFLIIIKLSLCKPLNQRPCHPPHPNWWPQSSPFNRSTNLNFSPDQTFNIVTYQLKPGAVASLPYWLTDSLTGWLTEWLICNLWLTLQSTTSSLGRGCPSNHEPRMKWR